MIISSGSRRRLVHRSIGAALFASVALALTACESPLNSGYTPGGGLGGAGSLGGADPYTQSLIARALADAGTAGAPIQSSTFVGGVREASGVLPRVDSEGPTTNTTVIEPPGFSVTTRPTIESVSHIGLPSGALNETETSVPLSLQEAIARTAKHNLAIRVEGFNPGIKESQIIQAMAAFDPVLFGQSQWSNTDEPQISTSFTNGQSWQHQIGVKELLPTGTQIQASASANYRDITVTPGTFLPLKTSWTTNLNLQLTQPLLRGFGTAVNEANIYLARADMRSSLTDFKKTAIANVANVEEAYHLLVQARTNVETLERLVAFSEETYNLVKERIILDVTKASLFQAGSALETRRASLLVAQKQYRAASDHLKGLMNDPDFDIRNNVLINPTDKPMEEPIYYNYLDSLMTAFQQRPEMQKARIDIERANIVVTVAKNDLLPKLDLVAGFQTNGLDNGLDTALMQTVNPARFLDFNLGIKIEVPLGNRLAEAQLKQRELERRQQVTNFEAIAQTVAEDVRKQLREVLSSFEEMKIRERVRVFAAGELEGIIDIEEIRPRTPEFLQLKLDSQQRLADAEQQLTQSIINYNLAIMRLEQAKGTLLEFNRISLDKPPPTADDNDAGKNRLLGKTFLSK